LKDKEKFFASEIFLDIRSTLLAYVANDTYPYLTRGGVRARSGLGPPGGGPDRPRPGRILPEITTIRGPAAPTSALGASRCPTLSCLVVHNVATCCDLVHVARILRGRARPRSIRMSRIDPKPPHERTFPRTRRRTGRGEAGPSRYGSRGGGGPPRATLIIMAQADPTTQVTSVTYLLRGSICPEIVWPSRQGGALTSFLRRRVLRRRRALGNCAAHVL